uniref:Uncharacterized protein n=1 Tax=Timema poppense TaxID=170557 RepID=A0A7R9CX86_TIMPO|nr:unnamed protein product [Timema poppensis]
MPAWLVVCVANNPTSPGAVTYLRPVSSWFRIASVVWRCSLYDLHYFTISSHSFRLLKHPNIVQLLETFEDKHKVYLIMEL